MTGEDEGCVGFLSPEVRARGGGQAMGGRAIGWDGGKNLLARRMSPEGESKDEARSGWVGERNAALVVAMPENGDVVVDLEVRHPPPRPAPRED